MNSTKNFLAIVCVLALVGATVGVVSKAAEEDYVTATVEIGDISVSVSPDNFDYGSMPFSTSKTSFEVISGGSNNIGATVGAVNTDLDIKASSTAAWTLSDSAIGANEYMHKFGLAADQTTEALSYAAASSTYATLDTDVASSTTVWFGLEIHVPSSGTTDQQSAEVHLLASWADA
jgi:hypothetical protein